MDPWMEEHFILRLPEKLKAEVEEEIARLRHPTSEIEIKEDGKIIYKHKNRSYDTLVVRLPCIVESYKTFDNKQFCKASDISTLVIVKEENNEEFDLKILESCGLTPPMKYVKVRRFRKRKVIEEIADLAENKIRELLEKDNRAVETTISYHNNEAEEETVKNIAEEIEASLFVEEKAKKEDYPEESKPLIEEVEKDKTDTAEIDKKIAKLEDAIKIAVNPILKKRFVESLGELLKLKTKNERDGKD